MTTMKRARWIPARWLTVLGLVTCSACGDDYEQVGVLFCPGPPEVATEELEAVSAVFEKRCGTLDCHGHIARPLKIYGRAGLRFFDALELKDPNVAVANETYPGGKKTTEQELDLNRRSICGLEPEKMTRVLTGEIPPDDLLLLQKPLEVHAHKGGKLFTASKNDPGVLCISSWLARAVNTTACIEAVQLP